MSGAAESSVKAHGMSVKQDMGLKLAKGGDGGLTEFDDSRCGFAVLDKRSRMVDGM